MNPQWLNWMIQSPLTVDVLVKITGFLALVWVAHFVLRRRNPRWRVLLWRGAAVGLILIPILAAALPGWKVAVAPTQTTSTVHLLPENNLSEVLPLERQPADTGPTAYPEAEKAMPVAPAAAARRCSFSFLAWAKGHAVWLGVGVWIVIASLLVVRFCIGWRRIKRMVKSTLSAPSSEEQRILRTFG